MHAHSSSFTPPVETITSDIVEMVQQLQAQESPAPFDPLSLPQSAQRKKTPSIIEIVEMVQRLKEAYRPITQDEREVIASWPGWGPYAGAFETQPQEKWQAVGPQLRLLLGAEGYAAASAATPTSFFTAPYISKAIWRLAEQLGFSGGAVLEPGCGTGQVLSYAPPSFDLHITGIEMEPLTAGIAQLLFPQAYIINAPIQEVALVNDAFDLVVDNVPFADIESHLNGGKVSFQRRFFGLDFWVHYRSIIMGQVVVSKIQYFELL